MKFVEAMGATHIKRDKLIKLLNEMRNNQYNMIWHNFPDKLQYVRQTYIPYFAKYMPYYGHLRHIWEEKVDGYSYLCKNGRFFSRSLSTAKGNEGNPVEKTELIPHLSKAMTVLNNILGSIDVHGELFIPGKTSDDVTTIMGCNVDKAYARQFELGGTPLHYVIYDVREFNGKSTINEPWYIRRAIVDYIGSIIDDNIELGKYISISKVGTLPPREGYRKIIRGGGEGIMIKSTNRPYSPGKKPAGVWIKVKKEVTADVVIMGYNPGTGKNKDTFGSIKFGMYIDGKLTEIGNVSSGIEDSFRLEVGYNKIQYIGKVMEISAMCPNTKKASFRHPRYIRMRYDKDPTQCTMDSIEPNEELL